MSKESGEFSQDNSRFNFSVNEETVYVNGQEYPRWMWENAMFVAQAIPTNIESAWDSVMRIEEAVQKGKQATKRKERAPLFRKFKKDR